jgi:uncharacterized radical SAM superfamily Fe-S cluster-containing enzyme
VAIAITRVCGQPSPDSAGAGDAALVAVKDGCSSDCGLCPEHKQQACLGVIEVNCGCNLDCPICFADSGTPRDKGPDGYAITLDQCATMLDVVVVAEGEPEVVMFSGGEPTATRTSWP